MTFSYMVKCINSNELNFITPVLKYALNATTWVVSNYIHVNPIDRYKIVQKICTINSDLKVCLNKWCFPGFIVTIEKYPFFANIHIPYFKEKVANLL